MTAAVYKGPRKLNLSQVVIPAVKSPNDVLIKVLISGSCGTDLGIFKGFIPEVIPPVILGHEVIGKIVESGNLVENFQIGDIVTINPHIPCGHCNACKQENNSKCINPRSLGCNYPGGFANYCLVPQQSIYKIPDTVPIEKIIFAEPIACVLNALQHVTFAKVQFALIIGAGTIGQLFIELLKQRGINNIIVSEPVNERREIALSHGANFTINPSLENFEKVIMNFTNGSGVDLAIDTAGHFVGKLVNVMAQSGQVVLFGLHNPSRVIVDEYQVVAKEIRFSSSLSAANFIPEGLELLHRNAVSVDYIKVTNIGLQEIKKGFNLLARRSTMKLFVRPD
jgi:2-desacetyl-2-hydroxyethyl bacteriochlorophyllide A dehydrogenase